MNMNNERHDKGREDHFRGVAKMIRKVEPNYGEFAIV
jgi:hypothetical protein